jgi:hypothetical protein
VSVTAGLFLSGTRAARRGLGKIDGPSANSWLRARDSQRRSIANQLVLSDSVRATLSQTPAFLGTTGMARLTQKSGDLQVRPPNVLQYLFAEHIGIAFTRLSKGNDLVSDGLLHIVGTIADPESDASKFQGNAEDTGSPRVEAVAVEEWSDWHGALPCVHRRERDRSLGYRGLAQFHTR